MLTINPLETKFKFDNKNGFPVIPPNPPSRNPSPRNPFPRIPCPQIPFPRDPFPRIRFPDVSFSRIQKIFEIEQKNNVSKFFNRSLFIKTLSILKFYNLNFFRLFNRESDI